MLPFPDDNATPRESKTARLEYRTTPAAKAAIQQAAALLGVDESAFVTATMLERARATIAAHERTVLSEADRAAFFAALDAPAAPTPALREAIALRRRVVRNAD